MVLIRKRGKFIDQRVRTDFGAQVDQMFDL